MVKLPEKLHKMLEKRIQQNALRTLTERGNLVDFSSNDYLGFARHYLLKEMTQTQVLDEFENGATGSRLLSGNHRFYKDLETMLCAYHKADAALVFNSGYDANLGFFGSVPQRNDIIFYDEYCHASIRDGIRLGNAKSVKFKHNDLTDLETKLRSLQARSSNLESEMYLVTEAVFSMDGDSPDLQKLSEICFLNKLHLIVDEAHAVGVFERGLVCELGLESQVFGRIITFGKTLGSHGAAILGSDKLRTYLINFARSLIYTTALSPHTLATNISAYRLLQSPEFGGKGMQKLRHNISLFKSKVKEKGLSPYFALRNSAIQICHSGGNLTTKIVAENLQNHGFDVRPILAPTVPKGKERLRFCIHAFNTAKEMETVLELLKNEL